VRLFCERNIFESILIIFKFFYLSKMEKEKRGANFTKTEIDLLIFFIYIRFINLSLYKNIIIIIIIRLKNIYIHQQIHYYGILYKQQQLILVIFEIISGH